jgi:hypothetical protein
MNGMKRWQKSLWAWGLLLALAALALPVGAQAPTRLAVLPASVQVPQGNDLALELYVTNGVDVNAFDVTVTYDPGVLALNSWAHGGYLSNLAVVSQSNQPGSLRLAATQLSRPPVSGDGVLLVLNFKATGAGTTPVTISRAEFAGPTGAKTDPERVHGSVTALSAPTFTPTATLTRTPTTPPTATALPPSATPPPTSTAPVVPTTPPGRTATQPAQPPTRPGVDAPQPGETLPAVPTLGSDPAYPGDAGPTLTAPAAATAGPGLLETPSATAPPPAEEDAADGEPNAAAAQEPASWQERALWGLLIAAGAAILGMFLIIIRRKTRRQKPKKEDYLL